MPEQDNPPPISEVKKPSPLKKIVPTFVAAAALMGFGRGHVPEVHGQDIGSQQSSQEGRPSATAFDALISPENKLSARVEALGPFFEGVRPPGQPSDGFRALTEFNGTYIGGTWGLTGHGVMESPDGGKTWNESMSQEEMRQFGIARDFVQDRDGSLLMVMDRAIVKRTQDGKWDTENAAKVPLVGAQTALVLPDRTLAFGQNGVAVSFDGKKFEGVIGFGLSDIIRGVAMDGDAILVGGWKNFRNLSTPFSGLGLMRSEDNGATWQKDPRSDQLKDAEGNDAAINDIKVFKYKGHKFTFIGGEGHGPQSDRKASPDKPFFWVAEGNGPFKAINTMELGAALGQDFVEPQRGILQAGEDGGILLVSCLNGGVAGARLDNLFGPDGEVLENPNLEWTRLTDQPSGHIVGITGQPNSILFGGQAYGEKAPPFLPMRKLEIE